MLFRPFVDFLRRFRPAALGHRREIRRLHRFERLEDRVLLTLDVSMLRDINTQPLTYSSNPNYFAAVNDKLFFAATTPDSGEELWMTVSGGGTTQVRDISEGASSSNPRYLTSLNGKVYFSAGESTFGVRRLWESDGTTVGTHPFESSEGNQFFAATQLKVIDGRLYFFGYGSGTDSGGYEIWQVDVSTGDAVWISDISQAGGSISPYSPLVDVNGTKFFTASSAAGVELWKADGTPGGTVLVKDISPTSNSYPRDLTNVNGTLYFSADDGVNGRELWKSNGTSAGTVQVKDINPGTEGSSPRSFTYFNGSMYFAASGTSNNEELWKSDGTANGTTQVLDLNQFGNAGISSITTYNGSLFFGAIVDGQSRLVKSDGTANGTSPVSTANVSVGTFLNVNGSLYFIGTDFSTTGRELWKTDGTANGTVLVKDINPGLKGSDLYNLTNLNGKLFFSADDGVHGFEVWSSDGTTTGTVLVKDINTELTTASSNPTYLEDVNGTLFFTATTATAGRELWKSDGTTAGTVLVKDINVGAGSSFNDFSGQLDVMTSVNGTLYFIANDGTHGEELWKSNGTAAGTVLVKDIMPGVENSNINSLTNVNGTLYFGASDETGYALWKSDGTLAGTTLVKRVACFNLTNVNGTIYFSGATTVYGDQELWKSDGTANGTVLVKDINSSGSSNPGKLTNVNGTLFFTARTQTEGWELWKSDGTTAGTIMVRDIFAGTGDSYPSELFSMNNILYFTANDGVRGFGLWRSDGTESETYLVKNIGAAQVYDGPQDFESINGTLYFSAKNGDFGRFQLWKSDGTTAGTVLVKDVGPTSGHIPSYVGNLTNVGGRLFFYAFEETTRWKFEVWTSDGTAAGTFPISDMDTTTNNGFNPYNLTRSGNTLYFAAATDGEGRELWRVVETNAAPTDIVLSESTFAENNSANATVGTFSATDADVGDTFTYSLVSGTGSTDNSSFTILGNALRITPTANFEAKSSYGIRVRVADQAGAAFEKAFTITIGDVNESPTDIGLSATSIAENNGSNAAVGTLTATDPDASNTFTYSLVTGTGSTDNSVFSVVGNTLSITPSTNFEQKPSYSIRLRAADQGGLSFEKQVTISVTNVNEGPTDISLSATSLVENNSANATVATIGSSDPDAGNTFTYSLVGGTGSTDNGSFTISGNSLRITPVADFETKSSYAIRLRVADQGGLAFEKAFTIGITNANESPTDIQLSASSIAENNAANATVGTLSATDVDSASTFTFSLVTGTGSTDNASFTISGNALRITPSTDLETKATYNIRLRATDQGGLSFEKQFSITVTNVNEAPTDIQLSATAFAEGNVANATVANLTSVDPDAGGSATFELVAGAGSTDNGSFTISGNALRLTGVADFETKASYAIRLKVTDQSGLTFEKPVTLTVTNGNEPPTNITLSATTLAENNVANAPIGTLTAVDADTGNTFTFSLVTGTGSTDNSSFTISGNELRLTPVADFETKSSYSIRIATSDQGGMTFEKAFTIAIINANDAPTDFSLSASSITENNSANATVGTLIAVDQDTIETSTFALVAGAGSTDNGSFSISGNSLRITNPADFESKASYSIRIQVTDQGGLTFAKSVVITIVNQNEAPTNITLSSNTITENNQANAIIGNLGASDPDASSTFTFSLVSGAGSDDNGSFSIAGNSLRITAATNVEAKSSYTIRVRVADQGGQTFDKQFTITVLNENEAPTGIQLSNSQVAENQPNVTIGSLSSQDSDAGDTATFSLVAGGDAALFVIVGNELRVGATGLDFEAGATRHVQVKVTDAGGLSFTQDFAITVTDVNESPTLNMDVDGSGGAPDGFTDGALIFGYLAGLTNSQLDKFRSANATQSVTQIRSALDVLKAGPLLDVDGSGGTPNGFTDGALIFGYLAGVSNSQLAKFISAGGTRSVVQVRSYLDQLTGKTPAPAPMADDSATTVSSPVITGNVAPTTALNIDLDHEAASNDLVETVITQGIDTKKTSTQTAQLDSGNYHSRRESGKSKFRRVPRHDAQSDRGDQISSEAGQFASPGSRGSSHRGARKLR